jgi:gamma-glutamylcyclotransferase (GGCT)/AIG2-like uncharacterized protein YtfP
VAEALFLYGTLLPGLEPPPLTSLVASLEPLGPATIPGRLYDFGAYPGAVFDAAADTRVCGDAFELPPTAPDLLVDFDLYEGFNPDAPETSLFRRVERTVTLESGKTLTCWVYEYAGDVGSAALIRRGNYRRWLERNG